MGSLGHVESWKLDKFHFDHLQPNEEFLEKARRAIDSICEFLKRRCFQDEPWRGIKVLKVVKGGSLGKGTAMKNATAGLELFSNIFKSYTEQKEDRKKIIAQVERCLNILKWREKCFSDAVLVLYWALNFWKIIEEIAELFLTLINIYKDQEKITEEIARRIDEWQKQPYLSDADLELLSNIFKSYTDQEKDWMMSFEKFARRTNKRLLGDADWELLGHLIQSYKDKEKDRKKIFEETERRVSNRQMKPHSSDVDLVLFLNIFKSYTDQEKDQKMIIEEIERRLDEWQKEPYLLGVDVGFLLDLLKSCRDQKKDPNISQKLGMWLQECKKELYLSDADLEMFRNIIIRFSKQEEDREKIIEEIGRWRNQDWREPHLSSADLGLLDLLKRYTDKEEEQKKIFEEPERWFNKCKENVSLELIFEKSKWSNPRVLQFKLRSKTSEDFLDFDILPAYDALGQYDGSMPNPQIYVDLINCGRSGEFSPCFTKLQRDFIVDRTTKLKNLIRLVKHWYREVQEKPFPPKYALELLTVYAWEQGSGQNGFDTAEGFRTVLWLIEKHKELRIYWTKYYDFDNDTIKQYLQVQLRKNRPVILDPADPTNNLGEEEGWDRLAEKAKSYADMNCCRKRDGSPVEPWNVPVANEVPWGEGRCTLL